MAYRDLEPVSKQLTIVVGLTVVGFMAFGLALSFYRNVLFEQTLLSLGDQNETLRQEILLSQHDIEYFRSAQYKDKYAKENLGKLRPGEKVLIITENTSEPLIPVPTDPTQMSESLEEALNNMPIIDHWKLYLFEREKLEELKRSIQ